MDRDFWVRVGVFGALLILACVSLIGFSTPRQRGTSFAGAVADSAGGWIGVGTPIPGGFPNLLISKTQVNNPCTIYLESRDRSGNIDDSTTTAIIGATVYEFFNDRGWDSLAITAITAGDTLGIYASN